jgi:hypothetical protein
MPPLGPSFFLCVYEFNGWQEVRMRWKDRNSEVDKGKSLRVTRFVIQS